MPLFVHHKAALDAGRLSMKAALRLGQRLRLATLDTAVAFVSVELLHVAALKKLAPLFVRDAVGRVRRPVPLMTTLCTVVPL